MTKPINASTANPMSTPLTIHHMLVPFDGFVRQSTSRSGHGRKSAVPRDPSRPGRLEAGDELVPALEEVQLLPGRRVPARDPAGPPRERPAVPNPCFRHGRVAEGIRIRLVRRLAVDPVGVLTRSHVPPA